MEEYFQICPADAAKASAESKYEKKLFIYINQHCLDYILVKALLCFCLSVYRKNVKNLCVRFEETVKIFLSYSYNFFI